MQNNNQPKQSTNLIPEFNDNAFAPGGIITKNDLIKPGEHLPHAEILNRLINTIVPVDFQAVAYPEIIKLREQKKELEKLLINADGSLNDDETLAIERAKLKAISKEIEMCKVDKTAILILVIESLRNLAEKNNWGLCKNINFIYLYNGAFWKNIDNKTFEKFLGEAAEKMGVKKFTARYYSFREQLFKQFLSSEYRAAPIPTEAVLINLQNGTFEITSNGKNILKPFASIDFITYQLSFEYNPIAQAPMFETFLNKVLPNKELQMIMQEYIGYIFIRQNVLKLEKVLLLYGGGANGKSVFNDIITALLGRENVSSFSMESLTNDNGYYRATIANMLLNYASEMSGKLQTATFKQLISGEPVEARLPYGQPFTLTNYSKFIFNCNELPKDVEHTHAYYRRFLIIPFDITIPEAEQDKQLSQKIIKGELAGVFNWVLQGLTRLLENKRFTDCDEVTKARKQYEIQSDSVRLFIDEAGYIKSATNHIHIKDLYLNYRIFCNDDGYKPVSKGNFIKRLQGFGILFERKNTGNVAFISVKIEEKG